MCLAHPAAAVASWAFVHHNTHVPRERLKADLVSPPARMLKRRADVPLSRADLSYSPDHRDLPAGRANKRPSRRQSNAPITPKNRWRAMR